MKFEYAENKKIYFELPDKWTVRTVLAYDSVIETGMATNQSMYERLWNALKSVADTKKWHCKPLSLDMNLEGVMKEETLDILKWACLAGFTARNSLRADEKN